MVNKYHKCLKNVRTTKKSFIRKHVKGTKSVYLKKKNKKGEKRHR